MAEQRAASGAAPPGGHTNRYAWLVLSVLCLVYVLNFLDRQLLSILAKPIQDELGVSDAQLGRIGGLYFALFYCTISIPVAWLADRTNRVRVLSIACALWSAATIACGLSASYPQLVLSRMAVGVGEAGGVPPSYSIISDYFAREQRGRALGLFNLGPPIGQALGVAFGAAIAARYDWRSAFVALGAVGIVTAAIVWTIVREPKRGATDPAPLPASTAQERPRFLAAARAFFADPVLRLAAIAAGATQFVTYASLNFTTLFLMREKGMTLPEIALWYALLLGIGVSAGIYASGWLVDRFAHRSRRAYALIPAAGLALAVLPFLGFVAAPTWPLALVFLIGPTIFNYFYLSPTTALVQNRVPASHRTLAGALALLVSNLIGLGLGPTYLGAVSDLLRTAHPDNPLQLAFYSLLPFYLIAIALFLALARLLGRDERGAA
ncbi:spinster family MFS transporter [Sphingomonas aracearum]|uniref:MFS transporter n=1 Tax=Sphingomonas aracearum TaxID=2283317 RepID=A0A369VY66_9SPHN|nr:MFS transporter [Sphingomonas aracearum]RDE07344.1 MFS transporter [Sphingomonas aracearum]